MTERVEPGWDDLRTLWRQQPAVPDALQARMRASVRRHSLLMRVATGVDVVTVLAAVALAGWIWGTRPGSFLAVWIAVVMPLAIGKLAYTLWNRRGTWRADSATTAAFVALSLRRAEARVRLARVLRLFIAFEVLAAWGVLAWAWRMGHASGGRIALVAVLVLLLAAGIVVWARWYGRKARREREELRHIQHQLGEEGMGG